MVTDAQDGSVAVPADRQRLGRTARLASAQHFKRVFAAGVRSHGSAFTVLAIPNRLARPRLGLAVARKHLRRAVDRNRAKRRIRESFRKNLRLLCGLDVVVMTRPGISRCRPEVYEAMLSTQWKDVVRRISTTKTAREREERSV